LIAKLGEDSCAEDLAASDKGLLAAMADLAERIEHLEYLSRHGRRRSKPKGRGRRAKKPEAAAQPPPKPPSAPIPQGKSFRARMLEKLGWTLELLSYGSIEEAKADLGFTMAILSGEPIEDCDGTSYRDYAQDIPASLRKEVWEFMAKARGALVAGKQGCDREAAALLRVVLGKLQG
jgi:hypothetical protein